jgi:hypothetical protein
LKSLIISLLTGTVICSCSTPLSTPVAHDHKYTVQILELEIPDEPIGFEWTLYGEGNISGSGSLSMEQGASSIVLSQQENNSSKILDIERLIAESDAQAYEYPIVHAAVGIPETIIQTKPASLTEDFHIENGKVILKKKTYQLGTTIDLTISEVGRDTVSYHIDLRTRKLKGYNAISIASEKIKMPVFSERQINTEIEQPLNCWYSIGSAEGSMHTDKGRISKQFVVRIVPPKSI